MQYEFTTEKVGKVKINRFHMDNAQTLTLHGIDAQESDANVIIGGISHLLGIVNFQNEYDPENVVRTVNESVTAQE